MWATWIRLAITPGLKPLPLRGATEQSIDALLSAIEQLDPQCHALWQACSRKTLDIGYRSAIAPGSLSHQLSLQTLARMQVWGIDLSITLYPVDE